MRHFDLRIVAALGAALLLGGAAVSPTVTLASTRGVPSTSLDQTAGYAYPTSGYNWPTAAGNGYPGATGWVWSGAGWVWAGYPANGVGRFLSTGNYYAGSGLAAWPGTSSFNQAGWAWVGNGSLTNGYPGLNSSGYYTQQQVCSHGYAC